MREQTRRYVENKYTLSVSELKSWFAYRMPYQVPPVSVSSSYGGRVYRLSFVSLSYDGERSLSCRVQSVGESGKTESNFQSRLSARRVTTAESVSISIARAVAADAQNYIFVTGCLSAVNAAACITKSKASIRPRGCESVLARSESA